MRKIILTQQKTKRWEALEKDTLVTAGIIYEPIDRYLERATDFTDIPKKNPDNYIKNAVECPVCKGYGKWNLTLNAYGEGKHFQSSCFQCNGWGYVNGETTDATCVHVNKELSSAQCKEKNIVHYGNCWHVVECTKCGHITSYDSSG